jgi:hypothetical protein
VGKIKIIKNTPVVYSGSFLQNGFGETVKHHGYGIYDLEKDNYQHIEIDNEYPFLNFKITDIEDIDNESEVLTNLG